MVDEGPPQVSKPNKAFTWSLSMGESYLELIVDIQFEDPNAVSSTSNSLDKLRITFVDTSEFLRCETQVER